MIILYMLHNATYSLHLAAWYSGEIFTVLANYTASKHLTLTARLYLYFNNTVKRYEHYLYIQSNAFVLCYIQIHDKL